MEELTNISEFVSRAADKCGFVREKYEEGKLPTNFSSFLVIPFFGDQKSEFVLASLLLHRLKEVYTNKYLVLCGWPGHAGFFPYVDEYWGLRDEGSVKSMLWQGDGFENQDPKALSYEKQLNRYFETLPVEEFKKYYDNGLTGKFFDQFKYVQYMLPAQPGPRIDLVKTLGSKPGNKVFIQPTRRATGWHRGESHVKICRLEFWWKLIDSLLKGGYVPVVYQDATTWDLSSKYADRCVFLSNMRILDLFAAMRATGCVLDIFSGLSQWAIAARTPFVRVVERQAHMVSKDYELDDLCANQIPYRYIFSYSTMLEGSDSTSLVETIVAKISHFLPTVDRNQLPSTLELSVVAPYMLVREQKAKRFGMRFFKIPKI